MWSYLADGWMPIATAFATWTLVRHMRVVLVLGAVGSMVFHLDRNLIYEAIIDATATSQVSVPDTRPAALPIGPSDAGAYFHSLPRQTYLVPRFDRTAHTPTIAPTTGIHDHEHETRLPGAMEYFGVDGRWHYTIPIYPDQAEPETTPQTAGAAPPAEVLTPAVAPPVTPTAQAKEASPCVAPPPKGRTTYSCDTQGRLHFETRIQ